MKHAVEELRNDLSGLLDSCVFPLLNAAGEKDEPEAIRLSEARFFTLAVDVKRDELLAEQSILGDEFGFTAR